MSPNGRAEDIQAAAAAWFERREWWDWDAAAQEKLEAWLSESTAHRIAFVRLEAAWERAERLKALGAGIPPGHVPARASFGLAPENSANQPSESAPMIRGDARGKVGSGRLQWAIGVASLAASLTLVVWYQSVWRWQTYGTQVGTIAPVALADGSRITLDSNTRIEVALDAKERLVRLDHGEALFEVAKDPTRPLIVEVANKRVTAVGTEFSVRRDLDEITVLVKEGRVRIEGDRGHVEAPTTELEAGGEASTHGGEITIERMDHSEVERVLSWREGYLEFQETPLPQVVTEFNRYRVQRIEIDDPHLNSIRIGGRFRCTDANAFLSLLQQGFPVVVTRDANRVRLHRREGGPESTP
jgi:transmembrane sensor